MKKLILVAILATAVWATDYSQMNTEELSALRGSVAEGDREGFRAEMQKRVESMTPQERSTFRSEHPRKQSIGNKGMQQKRMKQSDRSKAQGEQIRQRLQDGSEDGGQVQKGKKQEKPNNGEKKGKN